MNARHASSRSTLAAAAALLLVLVAAPPAVADRGICTSADVDAPVLMPDGSVHGPGRLTICEDRTLSPVSSIHSIRVDGLAVAMFVGRRDASEQSATRGSFMVFVRGAAGVLRLEGYARPSRGAMVTHRLRDPRRARAAGASGVLRAQAAADESSLILLARAD